MFVQKCALSKLHNFSCISSCCNFCPYLRDTLYSRENVIEFKSEASSFSNSDEELNRIYKDVMERYSVFPKQKKRIRNTQREWIKYRDEECVFEDFDGSGLVKTNCTAEAIALSILNSTDR